MRKRISGQAGAFVLMLTLGVIGLQTRLGATIPEFCNAWAAKGCSCNSVGSWSWEGSCDFSEEPDPLEAAHDYCTDEFDDCTNSCESWAYREWLVEQYCDPWFPEEPECYAECWVGYAATNTCSLTEESEWACACDGYVWCF